MEQDQDKDKPVVMEMEYDQFEGTVEKLKELGAEFVTLSSTRMDDGVFLLSYFFNHQGRMIKIRVNTLDNVIPSLYTHFGKSDFIEREINSLFGVKFLGHPNLENT